MQKYVGRVEFGDCHVMSGTITSASLRATVMIARERQAHRFGRGGEAIKTNSEMNSSHLRRYCALDDDCAALLQRTYERDRLSVRARYKTIKLARTFADIAGSGPIRREHLLRALFSRDLEREMRMLTVPYRGVYWVWRNDLRGISTAVKRTLLKELGDPKEIFHASLSTVADVLARSGARRDAGHALPTVWSQRNLRYAEGVLTKHEKQDIKTLCANDWRYTAIFQRDAQAPLVLYYRGNLAEPDVPVIGIIGSRSCTSYGRKSHQRQRFARRWERAGLSPRDPPSALMGSHTRRRSRAGAQPMRSSRADCTRPSRPPMPRSWSGSSNMGP